MFSELWKEANTHYKFWVSEAEIESKMASLWRENKTEMQVDFEYTEYETMMEKFDENIQECQARNAIQ